jgi:hypothetical protein
MEAGLRRALAIVFRRCAAVANLFSPTKICDAVWGAECLLLALSVVRDAAKVWSLL